MFLGKMVQLGTAANRTIHSSHPCSASHLPHPGLCSHPVSLELGSPVLSPLCPTRLCLPHLFFHCGMHVCDEKPHHIWVLPCLHTGCLPSIFLQSLSCWSSPELPGEPGIWGTRSQTHVGKPGQSCWAQLLPAQARVMPPSPHLEDKATSWQQLFVPPSPSTGCSVQCRQSCDGHIMSQGLAACHRVCAGNSHEAGLLLTQPFKLTPYVPYFPVCFVTIEISDSLLLQNRKQHIMV